VLDKTDSLCVSFQVQIHIVSYPDTRQTRSIIRKNAEGSEKLATCFGNVICVRRVKGEVCRGLKLTLAQQ